MNEHTGSEPLAVCTALSPVALINTEASLEISYYLVGAGQQPKFRDMEPAVAVPQMDRKVLLGILAGQKKRGKKAFLPFFKFFIFSYKLLPASRSQPPKHTRSQFSLAFALIGKQSKIVYLCSLPWDPASDGHINICSCRKKEKPNFFCDTCTTPLRLDIFWDEKQKLCLSRLLCSCLLLK